MASKNASVKSGRCNVAVDVGNPLLPVVGQPGLTQVRTSKRSRWRAATLIGIHLLIAAHITHYLVAGRTLSPVEPSESMYTLELGYLNCGFIFFIASIAVTLVLGRFFCGWACHIVALQDFCAWIMKTLGVRPRPFRSRLLALGPLVLALYMFVWPSVLRLAFGSPATSFPGLTNHLFTSTFWVTFPGPVFAALTFLTCGFAAVYFLGAKGFCTYGCPYGAFFGAADRLSPGRIVVSDACEQCGHCTATCTSNVRVHEEVRLYGMVVDPGCMKCMDCVSVCPKGALSFRFAKPSLFKRRAATPRAKIYDLSLAEEVVVAGIGLAATVAFRGLYDGPPLLMSIGLGGITAYAALKLWHLLREPTVRVQNLVLKLSGRVRGAGRIFAVLAGLWLVFTAHSGFVQWHRAWGRHHLDRTEAARADVLSGAFLNRMYSEDHRRAAAETLRHYRLADRWGLFGVVEVKLGLAWGLMLRNDLPAAERAVREAVALAPDDPGLRQSQFDVLLAGRRFPEAIETLRAKMALAPASAEDRFQLAGLLGETGRMQEAADEYAACVALAPDNGPARYNLGGLLRRLGRNDAAVEQLSEARRLAPQDADTHVELGLALMASGRGDEALESIRRAVALNPDSPETQHHLRALIEQLDRSRPKTEP